MRIGQPGRSIEQFYHDVASAKIQGTCTQGITLKSAYLSHSKDDLDKVELSVAIDEAVSLFGGFLCYITTQTSESQSEKNPNAFHVMMAASQQSVSTNTLPEKKVEQNAKDQLHNCVIELLSQRNLSFQASEVDRVGSNLVRTLQECLWYIDGRHHLFQKHSNPIPEVFSQFVGFNMLEKSKHRKRELGNIDHSVFSTHHQALFSLLQSSFWE